jgi:hypothetical protein
MDAEASVDETKLSDFQVVLCSTSGARVREGQQIEWVNLRSPTGDSGRLVSYTRYEDLGKAVPAPRELIIDVTCRAHSLDEAVHFSFSAAAGFVNLLAFTANVTVGRPRPYLAFDISPGIERRAFRQYYMAPEFGIPNPGRWVDIEQFGTVTASVAVSPHTERASRAVVQYAEALRNWNQYSLVMVLAHLYIACEALTPSIELLHRDRLGLNEKEHAELLGVDTTAQNWKFILNAWSRRKYLFDGNEDLYKAAREASDGFEHGFKDFPTIGAAATEIVRELFSIVRKGILDVLQIDASEAETLHKVFPIDVSAQEQSAEAMMVGAVADPNRLAAEGEPYPRLEWTPTIDDMWIDNDRLQMNVTQKMGLRFGGGVRLVPVGHRFVAGMNGVNSSYNQGTFYVGTDEIDNREGSLNDDT